VKLAQRLARAFVPPREAAWRYRRGAAVVGGEPAHSAEPGARASGCRGSRVGRLHACTWRGMRGACAGTVLCKSLQRAGVQHARVPLRVPGVHAICASSVRQNARCASQLRMLERGLCARWQRGRARV